jgi:hypothetical protein
MRYPVTLFALLLVLPLAGRAAPYAPQDFDFSGVEIGREAYGTVERVHSIDAFEHALRHGSPSVLLIRLDSGAEVKLLHTATVPGAAPLLRGDRVRIFPGLNGPRAEPAGYHP